MAKGRAVMPNPRQGRGRQQANRKVGVQQDELPSDDEVTKFHKSRDKLSLDPADDSASEGDASGEDADLDDAVYNLSDPDSDEDEDSDEEEDGRLAELKRQERTLRAQLRLQQGEDEGLEGDEAGEDEEDDGLWGGRKRAYYGDAEDEAQDQEELADEAAEALRLQRAAAEGMRPEDFEQEEDEEDEEGEDGSADEGAAAAAGPETLGQAAARAAQQPGGVVEEMVERDLAGMSAEEQRAAVMADAPELAGLLAELQGALAEVRGRIGPLLAEVRQGQLATAEGVSYLEAKHLLLLHYCISLVFYLLLKAEGRPVRDHPVIARLVEIRAFLERARPIDKRLRYQMDKLLQAAAAVQPAAGAAAGENGTAEEAVAGADDPLRYGPRPEDLVPRDGGTGAGDGGAAGSIYRPPKLNPVAMEDDPDRDYGKRARRREAELARRAQRSGFVRELVADIEGAPEELRTSAAGEEGAGLARARARLEARAAQEEELMARVPLSRAERQNLKQQRRAGLSGGAMLDDFADDIAGLVQATDGAGSGIDPAFLNARVSQKFGADLSALDRRDAAKSGDADLPVKAPLHERRARLDSAKAKQAAGRGAADMDWDDDEAPPELLGGRQQQRGSKRRRQEDDFGEDDEDDDAYREAAAAAASKKAARKAKYTAPPALPPLAEETVAGARAVSRAVEKNRGLTPHRRKDIKNPRVKNKKRYEAKSKARRGQVQEARVPSGAYGGEATGIKAGVAKSRRF